MSPKYGGKNVKWLANFRFCRYTANNKHFTEAFPMEKTFVTGIEIKKVRHLHDITIPLSSETRKHLILTGVNGSGKTSVLNALEAYLGALVPPSSVAGQLKLLEKTIDGQQDDFGTGIVAQFSSAETLAIKYEAGQFILRQIEFQAYRFPKISNMLI